MNNQTRKKPVVSYYVGNDPTKNMNFENSWTTRLTEINVIQTKNLSQEFIDFCVLNKHRIYLHIVINGMGKSALEPNIPSVKEMFIYTSGLIQKGFPINQILIVVSPILSNDNGIKSLTLLLKAFTEFKLLRLRKIRFQLLTYRNVDDLKKNRKPKEDESPHIIKTSKSAYLNKYVIANNNINKRPSTKTIMKYLNKTESFFKAYSELLRKYQNIISIDNSIEPLIGVRELMPFGYNNSWKNNDGSLDKIIHYENGNKFKPIVNLLHQKSPVRCSNKCLLCYFRQ
jgi:hypothetical protein